MTNVAEVKAAIDSAIQEVQECQQALQVANEKLETAQQNLAFAIEGSDQESVETAHAALVQASQDLEGCLGSTVAAVEQAQTYLATL